MILIASGHLHERVDSWRGLVWRVCAVEDLLEGLEDRDAVREDAVSEQERVQEVDREEAQVCEAL